MNQPTALTPTAVPSNDVGELDRALWNLAVAGIDFEVLSSDADHHEGKRAAPAAA